MAGGDLFKKVQSGQPLRIPAPTFNAILDVTRQVQDARQAVHQETTPHVRQPAIVLIRNDSGDDRQRFDILGLDGPLFTPDDNLDEFQNRVVFRGAKPARDDHLGRFVVLLEPIRDGQIGRAFLDGACPVRLDVLDDHHGFADLKDDDATRLESANFGAAVILWKGPEGDNPRWAIVKLGQPTPHGHFAALNEPLRSGASAEAMLLDQDRESGSLTPSDRTIEVFCPLVRIDRMLPEGTIVFVEIYPPSGLWNAIAADRCTVPDEPES